MHALLVMSEAEYVPLNETLAGAKGDWTWTHAGSPDEAQEHLQGEQPFDVVVCDLQVMGSDWLGEVAQHSPCSARVALTSGLEDTAGRSAAAIAHQCLRKPLDGELLNSAVTRTYHWRSLMADVDLVGRLTRLRTVPALPRTHRELMEAMQEEEPNLPLIAEIIADDAAMSARALQLINSPYFGVREVVSDIKQAVLLLGLELLRDLTMSHALFQSFTGQVDEQLLEALWREGHVVGAVVDRLTRRLEFEESVRGELRLAAFVHDIGRLALVAVEGTEDYAPLARLSGERLVAGERERYGIDHASAGAYLLNLWGLPEALVQTVYHHHRPPSDPPGWAHGWVVALAVLLVEAPVSDWPSGLEQAWCELCASGPELFNDACRDAGALVHGA